MIVRNFLLLESHFLYYVLAVVAGESKDIKSPLINGTDECRETSPNKLTFRLRRECGVTGRAGLEESRHPVQVSTAK